MTTAMGPPPARAPSTSTSTASEADPPTITLADHPSTSTPMEMGPPPPKIPSNNSSPHSEAKTEQPDPSSQSNDPQPAEKTTPNDSNSNKSSGNISSRVEVPYKIPTWSEAPCHKYSLEVLKDGSIIDQFQVNEKGAYMFGRVDLCDFVLEHPTISRFHAVLQFKSNGEAYLYDLGSTHGTFINKNQVKKRVYVELHVGDVMRFGHSSRLYIFQGPSDLMPPEADLKRLRNGKIRQEMQDMEASLLRAKVEASRADGISWGMREDAIEEAEDEADEITWQTYKGQLTEKQEKTRDKVIKRLEKIANMKKEIDAIRSKDISQGGLTQGQQTQIARNEQRISQIMEELENLEETLNESIRESIGARLGGKSGSKRKGTAEDDEDEYLSDDDEFYDRTKKNFKIKSSENQSIETADSLLDKKDAIVKEMEDKRKLLLDEKGDMTPQEGGAEVGDALDAYMSGLSSQLELDKKEQLRSELLTLQSELDRVLYLLKIADPTGEAAKKKESKVLKSSSSESTKIIPDIPKQTLLEQSQRDGAKHPSNGTTIRQVANDASLTTPEPSKKAEEQEIVADTVESKTTIYTVAKPQWLGAVEDQKKKESVEQAPEDVHVNDHFVDYKDRNKVLAQSDAVDNEGSRIENAAPGLIIRKRKQSQKSDVPETKASEQSKGRAEFKAEDAVALLLRHSKSYHVSDEEAKDDNEEQPHRDESGKDKKKNKRVLGPERPSFLEPPVDYESWVPPEGQSGDGRTSLNDRLGY